MLDLLATPVIPLFHANTDVIDPMSKTRLKQRECGDLEMDALECMNTYGFLRGNKLCTSYVQDYRECVRQLAQVSVIPPAFQSPVLNINSFITTPIRQVQRVAIMKRERVKQVLRGERKMSEIYDSIQPPRDAFQFGPFYN